jgi:hypothetical protein
VAVAIAIPFEDGSRGPGVRVDAEGSMFEQS